jgi:TetR/AcrR family transcriptional regulator, transcriptional repressor for nem operon
MVHNNYRLSVARPIEFDPDAVLQAVTDQFLATGYAGTSVNQLADATGVGKQSLYNALYAEAVRCAASRSGDGLHSVSSAATGFAALESLFDLVVTDCGSHDPARRHCIVSTGLLESIEDAGVQRTLRRAWNGTRAAVRALILRGQADGSVAAGVSADQLADHLMVGMSGLRVGARAQLPIDRLRATAALLLAPCRAEHATPR